MMIKAVIFDMFETLVSLFVGKTYFSEHIATDVGVDPAEFRKIWHEHEDDRTVGKLTIPEALEKTFKELGIYSPELVDRIASNRIASLKDTFDAIPAESVELLCRLKERDIKVGLITNTFSDERDFIRNSVLFPYFDAVRISFETGLKKPDPKMYISIMQEFGVSPDECLYVGDGGSHELTAARSLGMNTLQAMWFHDLGYEPHIPCPLLPDFKQAYSQLEVLDYIDGMPGNQI